MGGRIFRPYPAGVSPKTRAEFPAQTKKEMNASIAAIVPPEIPGDDYFNNVIQGVWKLLNAEPTIPERWNTISLESKVRRYSQKIQSFDRARPGELATEIIEWARDVAVKCNHQFSAIMHREREEELAGAVRPKGKKPRKKAKLTIDQIAAKKLTRQKNYERRTARLKALKEADPAQYDILVAKRREVNRRSKAKKAEELKNLQITNPYQYDILVAERLERQRKYEADYRKDHPRKSPGKAARLKALKETNPEQYEILVAEKREQDRVYQRSRYAKKKAARELLKATDPEYVALTEKKRQAELELKAKEKAVLQQQAIAPTFSSNL
jgi:hypothetical protein